jgi:hypothetical protein
MNLKQHKKSNALIAVYLRELISPENLHEFLYSVAMQKHPVDLLFMHGEISQEHMNVLQDIIDKPTINIQKPNPEFDAENPSKAPQTVKEKASAIFPLNIFMEKVEVSTFAEIFNIGFQVAQESGYEFYSIAEPEDVYSTYWMDTALKYAQEKPEIGIFTPLIRNVVFGAFHGYYNEAPWAEGMAEEAGKYDQNLLLKFNCASPLGSVIRMNSILEADDAVEIARGVSGVEKVVKVFEYIK